MTELLVVIDKIGGLSGKRIFTSMVSSWNYSNLNEVGSLYLYLDEKNTFAVSNRYFIEKAVKILKNNIKIIQDKFEYKEHNKRDLNMNDMLALIDIKGDEIASIKAIKAINFLNSICKGKLEHGYKGNIRDIENINFEDDLI